VTTGPLDPATEAARRGWTHEAESPPPAIVGAVFGAISGGEVTDLVVAPATGQLPAFEFGNLSGRLGGSRTEQYGTIKVTMNLDSPVAIDYGFVSIRLPRPMPHFVVDALTNDASGRSSLPVRIDGRQRVSLEGDADRHFALYAPDGYERDALYLFTPDIMALLIDETGDYDVELSEDRLTVFSPAQWNLEDPATWARIEDLVRILGGKAARQAARYRDERAAPGETVAVGGRRLDQGMLSRRGVGVGAIVALIVALGLTAAIMIVLFIGITGPMP
jgi:hypothetical protein